MNTKPLIVGLGNEYLGDDGVGVMAARKLRDDREVCADVVDCNISGVGLLDVLAGYGKVIFIDAVHTKRFPPGSVLEFGVDSFRSIHSDSPHHTGLAELISISEWLGIDFPKEIAILAVEVEDRFVLGAELSRAVESAIDPLLDKVKSQLRRWSDDDDIVPRMIADPETYGTAGENRPAWRRLDR